MVDTRYEYQSDKFKFFQHFEVMEYRENYDSRRAEYWYNKRLNSFLKAELGISVYVSDAVSSVVTERMSADSRNRYHNTLHVLSMLDFARDNGIPLSNEEKLAIYFHDAIYDVEIQTSKGSGYNEDSSIKLLEVLLERYTDVKQSVEIIYYTGLHTNLANVVPKHLRILDLDLSTFAYPYKSFSNAQYCLYLEYCYGNKDTVHGIGSQQYADYLIKREIFVDGLFSRPGGLYQSLEFKRFEKKALDNESKFREGK